MCFLALFWVYVFFVVSDTFILFLKVKLSTIFQAVTSFHIFFLFNANCKTVLVKQIVASLRKKIIRHQVLFFLRLFVSFPVSKIKLLAFFFVQLYNQKLFLSFDRSWNFFFNLLVNSDGGFHHKFNPKWVCYSSFLAKKFRNSILSQLIAE